jgi:salicylate hydroxylase
MSMKIAIVGAGVGGLAAALAMTQAGFTVEVYERAPVLLDQGAGITMAPNATRVLFHLGLEAALLSTAAAPPATDYRHYSTGFVFKRIDHQDSRERFGYPHLRFHRWDLQDAMVRQLDLIAPGALRLGWKLEALAQGSGSVELSLFSMMRPSAAPRRSNQSSSRPPIRRPDGPPRPADPQSIPIPTII